MNLEGLPPIGGLQESSLVAWEGRVAAVVALQGCNLACPACPVPHLVPRTGASREAGRGLIPVEGVLDALFSRRHLLDGVVVRGGEPLLHDSLPDLVEIIRSFGLEVRVDTNGTRPRALRRLLETELVDRVRLDLRAPLDARFAIAVGREVELRGVYRSLELLLGGVVENEIRLIVDPRLLTLEDVERVGRTVAGARNLLLAPAAPGLPGRRALRRLARVAGRRVRRCTVEGEPGRNLAGAAGDGAADAARGAA